MTNQAGIPVEVDYGIRIPHDDAQIVVLDAWTWPAWMANVAEHCMRATLGSEEAYWPTEKAMRGIQ